MNTTMADDSCIAPLGATTAAYLQLLGGWFRNNAGWMEHRTDPRRQW